MGGIVRTIPLRALLIAVLVLSGCSFMDRPDTTRTPPPDWETVEQTSSEPGVVIERVRYRSGDLSIEGQVCRPDGPGPYPVMIWNHGGFQGLGGFDRPSGVCAKAARSGGVVAASSYRGENGSDGKVEVCAGEVDDVLALLAVIRAQPYVDTKRIAMVGVSHGACITARAVERGAPIRVAVAYATPSDWAEEWRFLNRRTASSSTKGPLKAIHADLLDSIEKAMGGTPEEVPEEYARRSPLTYAEEIAKWDGDLLLMHGVADAIVPPRQTCDLADALGEFTAFRFTTAGKVDDRPPPACGKVSFSGPPGPPSDFPERRYVLMYDDAGHAVQGHTRAAKAYQKFLSVKLGP
jgi:dienelactone hydrolase